MRTRWGESLSFVGSVSGMVKVDEGAVVIWFLGAAVMSGSRWVVRDGTLDDVRIDRILMDGGPVLGCGDLGGLVVVERVVADLVDLAGATLVEEDAAEVVDDGNEGGNAARVWDETG